MAMSATEAHAKLMNAGVSESDVQALEAFGKIDWSKVFELVSKYGPAIVQAILAIFAAPTPAPTPQPATKG